MKHLVAGIALALGLVAQAEAAITFVACDGNQISTNIDITINKPAGTIDGDVLTFFYGNNSSDQGSVTVTGVTQIDFVDYDIGGATSDSNTFLGYKVASSEGASYTFNATGGTTNGTSASVCAWRGVDTSNPLDVAYVQASHFQAQTNDSTPQSPAITTVTNGAWVISHLHALADTGVTDITASTGYDERDQRIGNNRHNYVQSKAVATAGLETPGTVTLSGVPAAGIDWFTYTIALRPAGAGAGEFTVNPSITAETETQYTLGGTTGASVEVDCVSCPKDSATPSIAEVDGGGCDTGVTPLDHTSETWNGADSMTLDGHTFPIHDLYCTDGTNLVSLLDAALDIPAGKQRLLLTSIDTTSPYFGLGVAAGDYATIDTITDPDGYTITDEADGTISFDSGGDDARQLIDAEVYDVSNPGLLTFLFVWNNLAPVPPLGAVFPEPVVFPRNELIPTITLPDLVTDPEGDTVTVTALDPLPTGLAVSSSDLQGTPAECETVFAQLEFEDQYGSTYTETVEFWIREILPDVTGMPLAEAIAIIEALCE